MAVEPDDDDLVMDEGDQPEDDQEGQGSTEPGDEGEEELELTIGDEAAPASGERDTDLVKHLRAEIRRRDEAIAEARKGQSAPQSIVVGERPTLESCEYNEEKFAEEFEAWDARRKTAERAESEAEAAARKANEAWQTEVRNYEAKRAELKFPDAQEVVDTAATSLNSVQQAVVVRVADNPALVFYALGKNPARLAEIASITDPLKQAAAIAKLEGTLKVTSKRKAPDPEQIATGNASVTHGTDKTLERLEKKAAQTGDRTELIAYKRNLKTSAK